MIPKIIHCCWFGRGEMPELVQRCMASWHQYMPDWTYMCWNEDNFDVASAPQYVREAYEARKYAFVSDYVRLWALEQYGGLYMDVDFEVYKSFEPLLDNPSFAGYEGSKRIPIMMGVLAAEANNPWIMQMRNTYMSRAFVLPDGEYDMTPNTGYFTDILEAQGFVCDGIEKDWKPADAEDTWFHIYPVDYFCPGLTTGENIRSERTYCEHKGLHSWGKQSPRQKIKAFLLSPLPIQWRSKIIKLKRKLFSK